MVTNNKNISSNNNNNKNSKGIVRRHHQPPRRRHGRRSNRKQSKDDNTIKSDIDEYSRFFELVWIFFAVWLLHHCSLTSCKNLLVY